MRRRKFIKNTLEGISVLTLSPMLLASCQKSGPVEPNGKSVLIVGAGISGLAAAKKLVSRGFAATILEAQAQVGGRIKTNRSLGISVDEGASWIHGPNGNPITNIASQAGANTFLTNDNSVTVFDFDGSPYTDSFLTTAENQFEHAIYAVLNNGSQQQSFETVFNNLYPNRAQDRLWTYMLSAYLEFSTGGDISDLSSKFFYDDEEFRGKDVIITNGYDRITDFLAQDLDVKLNTRVSAIDYTGAKVFVSTNGITYEADYALVCAPLGVLRNNRIAFSPALPVAKSAAISNTQMGVVNKFFLIWDNAFWDTDLQYVGYTPQAKGKFNYFLNFRKFSGTNALMTFAYGDYALTTESLSESQLIAEIMQHLRAIYGPNIPDPTGFLRTRWGQDENTFGSYSFATNGSTSDDFSEMAKSVNDKLFFAGEHTEKNYRGTVHGAYLSGIREADKIIDLL